MVHPVPIRRLVAWNSPLIHCASFLLALSLGLLLTQLTLLEGVLFVGLAIAAVATAVEPLVGLATALLLGLLRAYLQTEVPQIPAQIAQPFVALTLAVWLARGLRRRHLRIPHPPLLLPLVLFFGSALLSLWQPVEFARYGLTELLKWIQILLLVIFISDHLTHRTLPWLLGALLLVALFQSCIGIWQFGLRGEGPEHFAIPALGDRIYRAYGTFEQPNPYAGYLGLMASFALGLLAVAALSWFDRILAAWAARRPWRHHRLFRTANLPAPRPAAPPTRPYASSPVLRLFPFAAVCLAMLVALGMSWSRGAWLGFGAAALVMAAALPRRARWGILLVAVLVLGGLGLYAARLLPASVTQRLISFARDVRFEDVRGVGINDVNYAVIERLAHWQAALGMFRSNLWTGVGIGNYEPAYSEFALTNWPIALGHAHNYYLNLAAETGVVGLSAYVILWGAVFWHTWRATRRERGLQRGVAIGLLGAWTHISVHHVLDNLYVNNVHLHIGVLLGLLAFIVQQPPRQAGRRC